MRRTPIALTLLSLLGSSTAFAQVTLPFEGFLTDANDLPITAPFDVVVRLYDTPDATVPVFEETHTAVVPFDGFFFVTIGAVEPLAQTVFAAGELYVGVTIVGEDVEL